MTEEVLGGLKKCLRSFITYC